MENAKVYVVVYVDKGFGYETRSVIFAGLNVDKAIEKVKSYPQNIRHNCEIEVWVDGEETSEYVQVI